MKRTRPADELQSCPSLPLLLSLLHLFLPPPLLLPSPSSSPLPLPVPVPDSPLLVLLFAIFSSSSSLSFPSLPLPLPPLSSPPPLNFPLFTSSSPSASLSRPPPLAHPYVPVSKLVAKVEKQIAQVEAEIEQVGQEIREAMVNDERKREEQLRDKENKLRDEKLYYLHRGPTPKGALLSSSQFMDLLTRTGVVTENFEIKGCIKISSSEKPHLFFNCDVLVDTGCRMGDLRLPYRKIHQLQLSPDGKPRKCRTGGGVDLVQFYTSVRLTITLEGGKRRPALLSRFVM